MKLFVITLFFCFVASNAFGQIFKGIIKDENGKPLSEVSIRAGNEWVETDKNGNFTLVNLAKSIFITKSKFRPRFIEIGSNEKDIEIKLESELPSERFNLPKCREIRSIKADRSIYNLVGDYIWLSLPKKIKVKKSSDIDYEGYAVRFQKNKKREFLNGINGPHATSGIPFNVWLESAREIEIRSIVFDNKFIGEDWRGISEDGKFLRYLRVFWEAVYYEVEEREAKIFFDKIIEEACFNTENKFWKRSEQKQ